ncbi:MAG: cytochrome-c peroxidase [Lewinellaceae bacterium]|nr:cytochrome-c peroxidase [Lewinellaceae bacterium]
MKNLILLLLLLAVVGGACQKEKDDVKTAIAVVIPDNFPPPIYELSANPVTPEGFALGKKLFYDPILSRDSSISCADCHISYAAFSHPDHSTSHGIDNQFGKRNAQAVQNMIWNTTFFWDGGVPNLDLVPLNPIQNPLEMDENPAIALQKLRRSSFYPSMFYNAFGTEEITTARFLQAMSQFMATLVSANSRYDHFVRKESGGMMSTEELAGLELFKQKCQSCHATDLFTDNSFRNNGINSDFSFDKGRNEVSTLPEDIGKFRVPSLRNIEATAPYMHNGKFSTLESVLDHYASGVKQSATLDPLLIQPDGNLGIPMTADEKIKIIAFLNTLTDEDFLRDTRFAE